MRSVRTFSSIAAVMLATVGFAFIASAAPKLIDFTQPIFVDGKPFIDENKCPAKAGGKRDCETPATLGELCYISLERPIEHQTWTEALKHDDLAKAVRYAKDFPLLDDQRTMIETAMGLVLPPAAIGVVASLLEPPSK